MKYLVAIAAMAASLVMAEGIKPANNVKEAKTLAEQKCTKGCLVLTPEEVKAIEANIQRALNEVANDAFEQGKVICNRSI